MKKKTRLKTFIILVFLVSMSPLIIWAAWNDGVGGENGFNVGNGTTLDIKQWSTCRQIQPVACPGAGVFVPTKTQVMWRDFTSNIPSCVSAPLINCY